MKLKIQLRELHRLLNIPGTNADTRKNYLSQIQQVKKTIRDRRGANKYRRRSEEDKYHQLFNKVASQAAQYGQQGKQIRSD